MKEFPVVVERSTQAMGMQAWLGRRASKVNALNAMVRMLRKGGMVYNIEEVLAEYQNGVMWNCLTLETMQIFMVGNDNIKVRFCKLHTLEGVKFEVQNIPNFEGVAVVPRTQSPSS